MDHRKRKMKKGYLEDYLAELNIRSDRKVWARNYPKLAFIHDLSRKYLPEKGRLLDIGLGDGYFLKLMSRYDVTMHGFDISGFIIQNIVNNSSEFATRPHLHVGSIDLIPYRDDSFDIVTACDILEHVPSRAFEDALIEIKRILKPGGVFIGTLPINENLAEGMVACPECGHTFHRIGHFLSFSRNIGEEAISRHFRITKFKEISYRKFSPFMMAGFLTLKMLRRFMPATIPSMFRMYTVYFIASR